MTIRLLPTKAIVYGFFLSASLQMDNEELKKRAKDLSLLNPHPRFFNLPNYFLRIRLKMVINYKGLAVKVTTIRYNALNGILEAVIGPRS